MNSPSNQWIHSSCADRLNEYGESHKNKTNKFILSDIDQLDSDVNTIEGNDDTGIELLFEDYDPKTGQITKEYRKVLARNKRKGETVLSADFLRKIEDIK